jgi:hypothetical protein
MARQIDTAFLLREWGVWLRVQAGMPRYVSPSWALMREHVAGHGGEDPAITDDMALVVDGLVCRLYEERRGYRDAAIALWHYHRYSGMSYRSLGRLMGITHVKAQALVERAEAWVDCALCHYAEAA